MTLAIGVIEGRVDVRWWNDDEDPGHVSPYAFVENLHVVPAERGTGVGRTLMVSFARVRQSSGLQGA